MGGGTPKGIFHWRSRSRSMCSWLWTTGTSLGKGNRVFTSASAHHSMYMCRHWKSKPKSVQGAARCQSCTSQLMMETWNEKHTSNDIFPAVYMRHDMINSRFVAMWLRSLSTASRLRTTRSSNRTESLQSKLTQAIFNQAARSWHRTRTSKTVHSCHRRVYKHMLSRVAAR